MKTVKIEILGKKWTLTFIDGNDPRLNGPLGGYGFIGMCHANTREIYVQNDLNKEVEREIIMHELTHAYLHASIHKEKKFNEEFVADFVGTYAEQIVAIADFIEEKKEEN